MNRASDASLVTGPSVAGIPYRYLALATVSFGVFLSTMDNSIVNVALPTLAAEFNSTVDNVLWISLTFILVSVGLGLSMGRLGDLYGRKRLYVAGFALFTVATAFASVAQSLEMLLAARVVQGVGGSMLASNGSAIITASFPASQRGKALGIMGGTVGAGLAAGPVLGGVLVDVLDWRALFYTRIPLGLIGSLLVWRLLRDSPAEQRPRGLDLPGSVLLFGMLFALVLAVNRGDNWGWNSPIIIALFAGGTIMVATFILQERRAASPVVDLALFKSRGFSAAILTSTLQFVGMAGLFILLPFYLIQARGFSQLETGGIMAAMPLTMFVVAPLSGILADRIGPRFLTTLAMALVAGGLLLMSTVQLDTSVLSIIGRLIAIGIGTAIFQSPNTSAVMGSVLPQRLGTAAASATTSRTMGQAIGVAVAGALFAAQSGAFSRSRAGLGLDEATLSAEALVSGLELAFLVGAAITALGIFTAWMRGSAPPVVVGAAGPGTTAARSQPSSPPVPIVAIERRAPQRGAAPGGGG